MKVIKVVVALLLSICIYQVSFAQSPELLDAQPSNKEEYIKSEKKMLGTLSWLENASATDQDTKMYKSQVALLTNWIMGCPTVNVELTDKILVFSAKNKELLLFFMGGYTRYSLENNYSKDEVKRNTAGIQSAIKVYKKGGGIKKYKEMDKLIALDDAGHLQAWVGAQLAKP